MCKNLCTPVLIIELTYKKMQYFRLFRFLVSLSSLSLTLFISGCVQSGNVFVAPNKVVLADQTPNSHFEQEVMITRISQVLLVGKMSNEERGRFTLNVAFYMIPSVCGASHVMTLHKPSRYSQRWLPFTII